MNAADCYEQLMLLQPDVDEYKMYYAQALYKACLYEEAMKVSCQIENPTYQPKVYIYIIHIRPSGSHGTDTATNRSAWHAKVASLT